MVAVTFFTQFLCMGFTFYSFGVVLKPLAEEFGGGRFCGSRVLYPRR
jgi:hypothetical protein